MKLIDCNTLITNKPVNPKYPMVLKGLKEGSVGMLIAAPGVGKSRFALSIALECASTHQLVGLSANTNVPVPTLVISSEDDDEEVARRMRHNLSVLTKEEVQFAHENLVFAHDVKPFVIPPESSREDFVAHQIYMDQVKAIMKKFKLVIVDTVSEIIGDCDEVKHDRLIKNTFKNLAKESGAAILLVHHINKNEIRGSQSMTVASGSGLSTLMRYVKFLLGISTQKNSLVVHYLKKNYLSPVEAQSFSLSEDLGGLIVSTSIKDMTENLLVEPHSISDEIPEVQDKIMTQEGREHGREQGRKRGLRKKSQSYLEAPDDILLSLDKKPDEDMRNVI